MTPAPQSENQTQEGNIEIQEMRNKMAQLEAREQEELQISKLDKNTNANKQMLMQKDTTNTYKQMRDAPKNTKEICKISIKIPNRHNFILNKIRNVLLKEFLLKELDWDFILNIITFFQ
ncbi:hypothetical protein BKN38_03045 [Helicobacter sp. CLO-3]|uniref:hypothetical protein n=1 Tax=unclassified Helicobacter TaxID=2593540 RepID=UPI000805C936|nr:MULTISPECIES: hypothetical protein [unclassified Helicobacter]OBV28525.1 hypothetical protein BA723_09180 [Helicobacter sp. CLO-3]OHU84444.1 hypothetical protein BKN38_03045 [Helicobacter sp. CLO-3]